MQNKVLIIIFLTLFLIMGCRKKHPEVTNKPDWVIEEKKMVAIIVDLQIISASTYTQNSGLPRNKAKDWFFVMNKYHVEDSIFRKSQDYYCKYPKVLEGIYEQVIDNLSEMQAINVENVGLVDTLISREVVH